MSNVEFLSREFNSRQLQIFNRIQIVQTQTVIDRKGCHQLCVELSQPLEIYRITNDGLNGAERLLFTTSRSHTIDFVSLFS